MWLSLHRNLDWLWGEGNRRDRAGKWMGSVAGWLDDVRTDITGLEPSIPESFEKLVPCGL